MKRYHEAFHFRDENGNVAGAYVYDTVKESGFPVNMDDFQKLVAGSEGMLPAGVMPIVKLSIVGEMLQIGIYANPIKLNEVRRRFGEMGKGFRSVKILGQDTLVIPVPVMAFEAYRGSLKDNLHDCAFVSRRSARQ